MGQTARSASDGGESGRLAASQARRMRRIVDAAARLAEEGGFDAVRLRDVAEAAEVALGTLYKYFPSKEDVLLVALHEETDRLESVMAARPPRGASPLERLTHLFARATRGLVERPGLARAGLRAVAASSEGVALKVAAFHLRMTRLIVAALRGEPPELGRPLAQTLATEREGRIALVLEQVWYAALLGWASGLHPVRTVTERVHETAALLLGEA